MGTSEQSKTPLERICRAMALYEYPNMPPAWHDKAWDGWKEIASAVLLAIREPSEAMEDAGRREGYSQGWEDSPNWIAGWQAMIDAALAESP